MASAEQDLELADVYAAALFNLASEARQAAEVGDELTALAGLTARQPELVAFLRSEIVDTAKRRAALERVLRGRVNDLLMNTLLVMNEHGRAGLLPELARAYELRREHAQGQIEVAARSAVPLSGPEQAQVEALAAKLSGRKPLVQYTLDAELIGGLVVQIGDHRLDSSVRRQLHAARTKLLERSQRGLQRPAVVGEASETAESGT
jgi:F-type H+-transporting ATPase subunit delta